MTDITTVLSRIDSGDPSAAEELLPLVYEELRKLAAARMSHEQPGQTLQATALVHEAYVRLVDQPSEQQWDSRGHFFAAAAEAMRRILIDRARSKNRVKHGGDRQRMDLEIHSPASNETPERLLAINECVEGVKEMIASATENRASVTLEFQPDVDVDEALIDVRERVDQAGAELPERCPRTDRQ